MDTYEEGSRFGSGIARSAEQRKMEELRAQYRVEIRKNKNIDAFRRLRQKVFTAEGHLTTEEEERLSAVAQKAAALAEKIAQRGDIADDTPAAPAGDALRAAARRGRRGP